MSDFEPVECPECGCEVPEFKIEECCDRSMCDECMEEHDVGFHYDEDD